MARAQFEAPESSARSDPGVLAHHHWRLHRCSGVVIERDHRWTVQHGKVQPGECNITRLSRSSRERLASQIQFSLPSLRRSPPGFDHSSLESAVRSCSQGCVFFPHCRSDVPPFSFIFCFAEAWHVLFLLDRPTCQAPYLWQLWGPKRTCFASSPA